MPPWAWALEPVRGCNLKCWHCPARLLPHGQYQLMTPAVWRALWQVIAACTPGRRVEMAQMGEPTLHPEMLSYLRVARQLSPSSQIQITTNGTELMAGRVTYRDLFKAGLNVCYVDMYHDHEAHRQLARNSRIPFYDYLTPPPDAPSPWGYHGPDFQLIVLMQNPSNWPEAKKHRNHIGTFLNHLDWDVAEKHGVHPVTQPLQKYCAQPFKYVTVTVDGDYVLCCQDFLGETAGTLGNVQDGPEGFLRFWFGPRMMEARRELLTGNRAALSECARCNRCSLTQENCDLDLKRI